jgi:hypothetical protein
MSIQEYTMVSYSTQRHTKMYGGFQREVLDCREETQLVEHGDTSPLQQHIVLRDHLNNINDCMRDEGWRVVDQQLEELPPVVPDYLGSVMNTCEYLPWVLVGEILVESLRLNKEYDTFHPTISYKCFCYAFLTLSSLTKKLGEIESGRGHGELLGRDHLKGVLLRHTKL